MLRYLDAPDLDRIRELLFYSPDTRRLHWRVARPPMIRQGEPAGTIHARDGFIGITVDGRRYQGQYLSYYLSTGFWPSTRLRFADRDKQNLDPNNLVKESSRYAMTPAAIYMRKRAATVREQRKRIQESQVDKALRAGRGSVRYNREQNLWEVFAEADPNRTLERYPTVEVANAAVLERDRISAWLAMNRYRFKPGDDTLSTSVSTNTTLSPSYAELANIIAYDPDNGLFYYRHDPIKLRADYLNTSVRRVVTFWGRQYPVAMLAWFLSHREWPARKSILARNGDLADTRLSNLYKVRR